MDLPPISQRIRDEDQDETMEAEFFADAMGHGGVPGEADTRHAELHQALADARRQLAELQARAEAALKPITTDDPSPSAFQLKPYDPKLWLYDGSPAHWQKWTQTIKATLGGALMHPCLDSEDYQGFDSKQGKPVLRQHVPATSIQYQTDAQSLACIWMSGTLTGGAKLVHTNLERQYKLYQADPDQAPEEWHTGGCRKSPSAYALYMAIKEHASPDNCIEKVSYDLDRMYKLSFPRHPDYQNVSEWFEQLTNIATELATQGYSQWLDGQMLCMHATNSMKAPQGPLAHDKVTDLKKEAGYGKAGGMTIQGLKEALTHQWPFEIKDTTNLARLTNLEQTEAQECKITGCGRTHVGANTTACWNHEDHDKHCKNPSCYHHKFKQTSTPDPAKDKRKLKRKEKQSSLRALAAVATQQGFTAEQAKHCVASDGLPQVMQSVGGAVPAPAQAVTAMIGGVTYQKLPGSDTYTRVVSAPPQVQVGYVAGAP